MFIPTTELVQGSLWTTFYDETLQSDTASIDTGIEGFPISSDHLLFMLLVRTTEAAVVSTALITFNNDTAGNYDRQNLRADNTTVTAAVTAAANNFAVTCPGSSVAATVPGIHFIFVPSYGQTTFQKQAISLGGWGEDTATETRLTTTISRWRSTAAVNRIIVTAGSGNLVAGSRLTVYGIG